MITDEERDTLIITRIQQAEATISEVERLLTADALPSAMNRIYYGMFYALLALALIHRFETSKHMQLIGWFNKNYIHTGKFPVSFGDILKRAFEDRIDSDYKVNETPSATDLQEHLANMKIFIYTIKDWLEKNPAT